MQTGSSPVALAITPDDKNLYVVNDTIPDHSVSELSIAADGSLSPSTDAPKVAVGNNPQSIMVPPTPGPSASFTVQAAAPGNMSTLTAPAGAGTYSWAFGDGSTGTGQTVTHAYGSAGSYTATLTETDTAGCGAPLFAGEAGPFTGHTSYCAYDPGAVASQTVTVAPAPTTGPTGPGHPSFGGATTTATRRTDSRR